MYTAGFDTGWDLPEHDHDRAAVLTEVAAALWRDQQPMRDDMVRMARVYDNLPVLGLSPRLYRVRQTYGSSRRRVPLNVVKAVVDTYVSLVTDDMPKLTWQTTGLDWGLQRRARLSEQFVDGVFYDQDMYVVSQQCVRDSALFPFGCVKVSPDERDPARPKVRIDRVLPWEVLADPDEAMYGRPERLYQVSFVEKRALEREYPDKKDQLQGAGLDAFEDFALSLEEVTPDEWCAVVEGWALPSYGKPGRWTQAAGQVILDDRPWTRRSFPHKFLYKQRPLQGIWATPLSMDLAPIQSEIAKLLYLIERSIISSVGHIFVEESSNVNTNLLDNVVGSVVKYRGVPPSWNVGRPFAGEVVAHLNMLWQRAFEMTGVSQMAAGGEKPAGLNSGKAQLVYADTVSKRFTPSYREYQQWFRSIAEETVACANEVFERHPDFSAKPSNVTMATTIKWADAFMAEDDYQLQLYPTNKLADDPAARFAEIDGYIKAGMISPEDGRRLLDMPDLQNLYSLQDSAYNLVMQTVEAMMERAPDDPERYLPPDPYFGEEQLVEGMRQMRMCYWKARVQKNVPPGVVDLMQRWMDQADQQLQELRAMKAAPPTGQAGEGGAVEGPGDDVPLEAGPGPGVAPGAAMPGA